MDELDLDYCDLCQRIVAEGKPHDAAKHKALEKQQ
jgi:hypothetical protein